MAVRSCTSSPGGTTSRQDRYDRPTRMDRSPARASNEVPMGHGVKTHIHAHAYTHVYNDAVMATRQVSKIWPLSSFVSFLPYKRGIVKMAKGVNIN